MMKYLVTGSSGHLGEALVRTLIQKGVNYRSIDIKAGAFTTHNASIQDTGFIRDVMEGVDVVFHAATLHKPHIATHSRQEFIDTNVMGTRVLLDTAAKAGVKAFIFTSTTSTFGHAMKPERDGAAVWVDENLKPIVKNIYGATKLAAETFCELVHNETGLPVIILRVSRFFPEDDDNKTIREGFSDANAKANEFLNRRVDIEDMVSAHFCAAERASNIGCARYVISATSPFTKTDTAELMRDASAVVSKYHDWRPIYEKKGWRMPSKIERVYDNSRARRDLGWKPGHSFATVLERIKDGHPVLSELAGKIGKKGYHDQTFDTEGPYPVLPSDVITTKKHGHLR